MNREVISDKQGIILVTLFILGSSIVIGTGTEAGRDSWLALILGMIISFPVLMIYSRILSLFPEKDLFDIVKIIFGKFLGKILVILYVWFAFHLGALVLRNFGEFMNTVALQETPDIIPMIMIVLLCAQGIKLGIEVIGRWGVIALILLVMLLISGVLSLIPNMDQNNIQPTMAMGIKPILMGAFSVFSFPFAETVLFSFVFSGLRNRKSPYRVYIWGGMIGGLFLLTTTISNILILGESQLNTIFFPSHAAVSRTNVGDFIQRTEIIVAIGFLAAGFVKISICLLATCKGIAKLIGNNDYRFIVTPTSLLMVILAYTVYDSTMEMTEWAFTTWSYYAFLFQAILPVIIWISAEIKKKSFEKKKHKKG